MFCFAILIVPHAIFFILPDVFKEENIKNTGLTVLVYS